MQTPGPAESDFSLFRRAVAFMSVIFILLC
jgi:hypothetical protein